MTEQAPAWLVAWREGRTAPAAPAQSQAGVAQGDSTGKRKRKRAPVLLLGQLIKEPTPWKWDGGVRREAVLDHDHDPPRVIRKVGWRVCMRCSTPFFSDDVVKLRMFDECKLPPRGQRRTP